MMYSELSREELTALKQKLQDEYDGLKSTELHLDMSRGKPGPAGLDLTNEMLNCLDGNYTSETGVDCRNYGVLDGIYEAKRLFMPMLGVGRYEIIIGGNSSLQLMYDAVARAMLLGVKKGAKPWSKCEKVKFLCPVPGYDRHFAICESMGIEMINVPTGEDGPDMDVVEKLVSEDEFIKGIWCVPMYSNPTGITYSDEVVRRFARLKPKAEDFRIFWDNAYAVHHLTDKPDELLNILTECKNAGNPDMVYIFSSSSKISFPGGGLAIFAGSEDNVNFVKAQTGYQTIGFDKLNQLRHAKFFGDYEGIKAHMRKHLKILRPKFDAVLTALEKGVKPHGLGLWHSPKGGYFISFDGLPGTAKRTVQLCKEAGVVLTGAGATFPYGKDPQDRNIRIAPTYPDIDELRSAMAVFCASVRLASAEILLGE